ncbi:MAG: S8 family serine peptidase [Elusimicrobiales bacterium]|nr:S8 family serine peptidase [Elusimicrobiales bacterium]
MTLSGAPARLLLAGLLCLLAVPRAAAVKTERLHRFAAAGGSPVSVEVVSGSALVRFKAGISSASASAALGAAGFSVATTFELFGFSAVRLPDGMPVAAGLDLLKNMPQVASADPNRAYRLRRNPSDTYAASQYALARMQAFGAWEYETGSSSRVTVAVVDTGIDGTHPELAAKLTGISRRFDPNSGAELPDNPPTPACNHASRVAGAAAAVSDNAAGVAGVSWGARLLSLKIFDDADCTMNCDDEPGNSCTTGDLAIIAAINYAIPKHNLADYGKIVLNMSIGELAGCSAPLQTAVTNAVSAGLLLVAAAGNSGAGFIDSPANCTGVYAVGATDLQDQLASFSNTDTLMITKGLTAPGADIFTTDAGGGYASATGTSFASPLTAGAAALVWSAAPSYTPAQVFDVLKNSADDLGPSGPDRSYGFGRVNAYRAVCSVLPCRAAGAEKKAAAYPNPFRPSVHHFAAFKTAEGFGTAGMKITVYTPEGELVRKLDGMAWDGKNDSGAPVASGVYVFLVKTDSETAVGKLALIR